MGWKVKGDNSEGFEDSSDRDNKTVLVMGGWPHPWTLLKQPVW